jgi:hypothetical protein
MVSQTRGIIPQMRVGQTVIGLRYLEHTNGCRGNISITAGRDGGLPKDEKSGLTRI